MRGSKYSFSEGTDIWLNICHFVIVSNSAVLFNFNFNKIKIYQKLPIVGGMIKDILVQWYHIKL